MAGVRTGPGARFGTDPLEKRSLAWSALGLGMLVAIVLIATWTLRQVSLSDYWVDHTREVILSVEELLFDLHDAEAAQRAYMATGQTTDLATYRQAASEVHADLEILKKKMSDKGQLQRLEELGPLVTERMTLLAETIAHKREHGSGGAPGTLPAGVDKADNNRIRDLERELQAEEYRLLQEGTGTRATRIRRGFIAIVGAFLVALGGLVVASLDVRRAVRQRNAAMEERHESAATAESLFEAAAQAIFIVDKNGRIRMANPATAAMFGFSVSEVVGHSVEILLPEHLRGGHVAHRERYFGRPQTRPMGLGMDLQARRKDGTTFYAEISLSHIESAHGMLAVAFVTDISKRRADEQEIRQQREELQQLAGSLLTAQDEERRRIARDLHDDLSQTLASLAIDLGRYANKAAAEESTEHLRVLQKRATTAAESVRRISHRLHSSVLDDIGLVAALEQFCEEFQERSGIQTSFASQDVPEGLGLDITSSVYNIAQECLRNVSKHSGTGAVAVRLELINRALLLTVKDKGVGFLMEQGGSGKGIGIAAMQERARLLQGRLSIQSQPGMGTEVQVEVPLRNAE